NTWTNQDTDGHGTLTATIIAGKGNNGTDGTGYCWGCRIMPVRVSANGSFDSVPTANGIRWAADHGARIISIGFSDEGTTGPDQNVADAVAYAYGKGVLVVASAGNSGASSFTHPAS